MLNLPKIETNKHLNFKHSNYEIRLQAFYYTVQFYYIRLEAIKANEVDKRPYLKGFQWIMPLHI